MMKVIFRCKEYIYLAGTYLVGILELSEKQKQIQRRKLGNPSLYRALPLKAFPKL